MKFHTLSELNSIFSSKSLNANVYITYGTLEKEMAEPIDTLVKILNDRRDDGLAVQKKVIEGSHQTAFPMTAIRSAAWLSSLMNHVSTSSRTRSHSGLFHISIMHLSIQHQKIEKDGITVDTLSVDSNNRNAILKLSQEIFDGKHGNYDALLISHKNKLVF